MACFCGNLRRTSRMVTRVYEEEFRSVGFTGSTQYGVLRALNRTGATRQRDLGESLAIDEATLSRTLKPLLKKGWVQLGAGSDRREKMISLTKSGRQQVEIGLPAWERAQERIKQALPAGLWDAMMTSLPEVARATRTA